MFCWEFLKYKLLDHYYSSNKDILHYIKENILGQLFVLPQCNNSNIPIKFNQCQCPLGVFTHTSKKNGWKCEEINIFDEIHKKIHDF